MIVGISGLRWNQVTAAGTPELWRLAGGGSVGSLVDYAQQPLSCPADGWLTLNAAARAQGPRPCRSAARGRAATAPGPAFPAMPQIIAANRGYHESPDWGLLGSLASCATAVGPGAALALATRRPGAVPSYLPSAGELSAAVLARCPLTVVDLGQTGGIERTVASALDRQLAADRGRTARRHPAPGHLPWRGGRARAGRRAGRPPAPDVGGGQRPRVRRRPARLLVHQAAGDRDADRPDPDGGRLARPPGPGRDRRRADRPDRARGPGPDDRGRCSAGTPPSRSGWPPTAGSSSATRWPTRWPSACPRCSSGAPTRNAAAPAPAAGGSPGVLAAAVPLGSYLANLIPWWRLAHPAWWLYGLAVGWTLVGGGGGAGRPVAARPARPVRR